MPVRSAQDIIYGLKCPIRHPLHEKIASSVCLPRVKRFPTDGTGDIHGRTDPTCGMCLKKLEACETMSKTVKLPRVDVPKESRVMRDRRTRKDSRSSVKAKMRKEWQ